MTIRNFSISERYSTRQAEITVTGHDDCQFIMGYSIMACNTSSASTLPFVLPFPVSTVLKISTKPACCSEL